MGVTDVDPFIMGMTQAAGTLTPLKVAVCRSSNRRRQQQPRERDLRAYSPADRETGVQSFALLTALAALGLAPLLLARTVNIPARDA